MSKLSWQIYKFPITKLYIQVEGIDSVSSNEC